MLKLVVYTEAARLLMVNILPLTNNNDSRSYIKHTHTYTHTTDLGKLYVVKHNCVI